MSAASLKANTNMMLGALTGKPAKPAFTTLYEQWSDKEIWWYGDREFLAALSERLREMMHQEAAELSRTRLSEIVELMDERT